MKRIVQGQKRECSFDCIYCFTKENYITNGKKNLNDEELASIDLIQPFADFDVFACKDSDWKKDISEYVKYGKTISFATKAYITEEKAAELAVINKRLKEQGAFLHIGISITTIDNLAEIERYAPKFEARCKSLRNIHSQSIPCSVIIRPVLPTLSTSEIARIVDNTYEFCDNYVYGPLYMNSRIKEHLITKGIEISSIPHQATWLNNNPMLEIYNSNSYTEIIDSLINYCNSKNMNIWDSNSDAVEDIKNRVLLNKQEL